MISKDLFEISKKLEFMDYNSIYIDDIFNENEIVDDLNLKRIIDKYACVLWENKRIEVDKSDAEYLLSIFDSNYHVLIKVYLCALISSCFHTIKNSDYMSVCEEFMDWYFSNIDKMKSGLPWHNFKFTLNWAFLLFPKQRMSLTQRCIDEILKHKYNEQSLNTLAVCAEWECFYDVIEKTDYDLFVDFIINGNWNVNVEFIYRILNSLLIIYKEKTKKQIKKLICDYVLNNIYKFNNHFLHEHLKLIREYMGEFDYNDCDYNKLDQELERVNSLILSQLKEVNIDLSHKQVESFEKNIKNMEIFYGSKNNYDKIIVLLSNMTPISKLEIKKNIENDKKSLFGMVSRHILDKDGGLINYKKLNEEEKFSLFGGSHINLNIIIKIYLYYGPFIKHFTLDEETSAKIDMLFQTNLLLDNNDKDYNHFVKIVKEFMKQNYEYSFDKLIIQLERSLRYFFKNLGYNVMKKGKNEFLGLSAFFNNNKQNRFRDELLKVIDEDYYFTLSWLLTDDYGMNYRGNNMHGLSDLEISKTHNAIYASIMIIRFYLGFMDNAI